MIPSSPPSISREQSLPSSPPALPTISSFTSKKRRLSDYVSNSSDPLFSEDPSEAELCSADSEPRKKVVRAPWWALNKSTRVTAASRRMRRRHRNNDSGVWMQSDDSVASLSSQPSIDSIDRVPQSCKEASTGPAYESEHTVHLRIQTALEDGNEVIDLGDCGLQSIANGMLRPLHQLIKQPHDHDNYRPLTPELQLFLHSNMLQTLPTELFRLDNLTVLSLRNNKLETLPPQICHLRHLRELNVSSNLLQYLPWEALNMTRHGRSLKRLTYFPNPALPTLDEENTTICRKALAAIDIATGGSVFLRTWLYRSHSPVTYFDSAGRKVAETKRSAHSRAMGFTSAAVSSSTVPSLTELALQRVMKTQTMDEAMALLTPEAPAIITVGLKAASFAAAAGLGPCSTCQKPILIARAEWIEWWSQVNSTFISDEQWPFLKRACSFVCARPAADVVMD